MALARFSTTAWAPGQMIRTSFKVGGVSCLSLALSPFLFLPFPLKRKSWNTANRTAMACLCSAAVGSSAVRGRSSTNVLMD